MVWSQSGVVLYLNHFLADADNGAMFCPDFLTFEANFNIVQGLKRDFKLTGKSPTFSAWLSDFVHLLYTDWESSVEKEMRSQIM